MLIISRFNRGIMFRENKIYAEDPDVITNALAIGLFLKSSLHFHATAVRLTALGDFVRLFLGRWWEFVYGCLIYLPKAW